MSVEGTPVRLQMRQSTIGNGDVCHLRLGHEFWFHPGTAKGSSGLMMGTGYHAALEAAARRETGGPDFDMASVIADAMWHEFELASEFFWYKELDFDACVPIVYEGAQRYLEGGHAPWDNNMEVLEVEWQFTTPWRASEIATSRTEVEWDAHGTADLLCIGKTDGHLYLIDHKFPRTKWREGKDRTRQNPQMAWYIPQVKKWWAEHGDGVDRPIVPRYDVMAWGAREPFSFESYHPIVNANHIEMTRRKAEGYAQLIEQGSSGLYMPNTLHYLCHHEYCDHWYHCDYGESFR